MVSMKTLHRILLLVLFFGVILTQAQELPPKPAAWCNDYAGVLTPSQKDTLNAILGDFERRTSNQIFIAIFRRLPENTYLEDFAVRLFEQWRPGLPDKNNGILIVIFTEDRKARIEVGYGLEDVITDLQARQVLYNEMIPYFKRGDYYRGLLAGLRVLMPAAEGKYKIPIAGKSVKKKRFKSDNPIVGIMTIAFIFLMLYALSRRGRYQSMTFGGGPPVIWYGGHPHHRRRRRYDDKEDDDDFFGGSSGGGFGGGFSGGFGGLSGGGGASGSW